MKCCKFLILALCFIIPLMGKSQISILIDAPLPGIPVDDQLDIVTYIESVETIDSVTATVSGRQVRLVEDNGAYMGSLSLLGLPEGILVITVSVTDVLGTTISKNGNFTYNRRPLVDVTSPSRYDSYTSRLHVKATVTDPGQPTCQGTVKTNLRDAPTINFQNSIDTLIDFVPGSEASFFELIISATGSDNQQTQKVMDIYFDKSPYLSPVYKASGFIAQAKGNRLLTTNGDGAAINRYSIENWRNETIDTIDLSQGPLTAYTAPSAILASNGAVVTVKWDTRISNAKYQLYLWQNDSLISISQPLSLYPIAYNAVQSEGNYVMWMPGNGRIALTDLTTHTTIQVGSIVKSTGNYLSSNGNVLFYTDNSNNVYKYDIPTQTTSLVARPDANGTPSNPRGEGNHVVYIRRLSGSNFLYLKSGTTEVRLGKVQSSETDNVFFRDSYILFSIMDATSVHQVYLRNPAGIRKQLTSFTNASSPDVLGRQGTNLFSNLVSKYYADTSAAAPIRISGVSKSYYLYDTFYCSLAGSLYRYINIPSAATPPAITNMSPNTGMTGSLVTLRGTGFTDVSAVSFGDTAAASFTVSGDTSIIATVGAGASGAVSIATPAGSSSLNGFTYIYSLPADNFTLTSTSTSCKGSTDGSIQLMAKQDQSYTATITGNGIVATYPFETDTYLSNLAAGTYSVCITAAAQPGYQQCFTTVIQEPEDLSVYIRVASGTNRVELSMQGGEQYHVAVNDSLFTTQQEQLTLPIRNGVNKIVISTNRLCQGQITKNIVAGHKVEAFPNPFHQTINISLGTTTAGKATISIYNAEGVQVYKKRYNHQAGIVSIDLSSLNNGLYLVKVNANNQESTLKLLKY